MPLSGSYVTTAVAGEAVRAFVPAPLPPRPPIDLTPLVRKLDRANQALGRLDGLQTLLPDPQLFMYLYVRKEAVLSSQIEGTQSSLSDLLLYELDEAPGAPLGDVAEVSSYVAAMNHGLDRLRGGFPLSLRLIREVHEVLLRHGRGADRTPGEFRRSQNWIGGSRPGNARFVPAPPQLVLECMGELEKFLHDERTGLPLLVKAALAHVQFETIHPFLDGNGRVGRLLVTLLLCAEGVLSEPLLYLSLFLKKNRDRYYDLLQRSRTEGAWGEWLEFFLDGVVETAGQAGETARRALRMFDEDRQRLRGLGRTAGSLLRVHESLRQHPAATAGRVAADTGLAFQTATSAIERLCADGLLREVTGRRRDRVFVYRRYLDLLAEGTEPIPGG
jgi:Fic family protein